MYLEVNTTSKEQGYRIKDDLDTFLKEEIFPAIENKLKSLEKQVKNKILRIDRLEFETELKNGYKLIEIKQKIVTGIENSIQEQLQTSKDLLKPTPNEWPTEERLEFFNTDNNAAKALIYFLEKGTSPWWGNKELFDFLFDEEKLEKILDTKSLSHVFQEKIKQKKSRKRFIQQFSDRAIKNILTKIFKASTRNTLNPQKLDVEFDAFVTSVSLELRFEIWNEIIRFFQTNNIQEFYRALSIWNNILTKNSHQNHDNISDDLDKINTGEATEIYKQKFHWLQVTIESINRQFPEIRNKIPQFTRGNDNSIKKISEDSVITQLDKTNEYSKEVTKNREEVTEEGYYIANAGLILIHPFLKHFFENCHLLDDDGQMHNPELAIHLLHYVTTKQEQQPENLLIFEKFLCNIPIHESMNRNINISKEHKDQSEVLLQAVVQNWGALKNASSDLLRNEFLQRPGKLLLHGKNPKIIVERKTQDILLDRLPWNISIVKLPWRDTLLFVDW